MPQLDCTRCGWCCKHVLIKIGQHKPIIPSNARWMEARGIKIYKDQLIIPSTCQYLGAEDLSKIKIPGTLEDLNTNQKENWVCRCMIQDKKPIVCSDRPCLKKQFPEIDKL